MMNTLEKLRGKSADLKLASFPKSFAVTVANIEASGVWVAGSTIVQAVVEAGAVGPPQSLVVFVPFQNVEWLVAEKEPGL